MPTEMIDFTTQVWWTRYSSFLIGMLILMFAGNLATRQWGRILRIFVRNRTKYLQEDEIVNKRWVVKLSDEFVRFYGNTSLVAGTLVMAVLIIAVFFPSTISPHDPEVRGRFMMVIDGEPVAAPYSPGREYILGSDIGARDLLSRLIHGSKETLTLVLGIALFRLAIGGLLGGVAGWRRGVLGQQILSFSAVSSSIPSLLFALIFILAIGPQEGFGVFLLGLGLTGWAELTNLINGAVRLVRAQPYVESAIALGSSPVQLIRRHLLPNLAPQLLPAVALEVSSVLLMLGELGFLGVYVGERFYGLAPQELRLLDTMEWSAMLAGTRLAVFNWPWLPIVPAATFLVVIFGFNLLAVGLRGWLDPFQTKES